MTAKEKNFITIFYVVLFITTQIIRQSEEKESLEWELWNRLMSEWTFECPCLTSGPEEPPLLTSITLSVVDCWQLCRDNDACDAFSFNQKSLKCKQWEWRQIGYNDDSTLSLSCTTSVRKEPYVRWFYKKRDVNEATYDCQELKEMFPSVTIGDFVIRIRNHPVTVYCLANDGELAKTYLNAIGASVWAGSKYSDNLPLDNAVSTFSKVRIEISECMSYINPYDTTFATYGGAGAVGYATEALYFGRGGDCFSSEDDRGNGESNLYLITTAFSLSANLNYSYFGWGGHVIEKTLHPKEVYIKGAGGCGYGYPATEDGLEKLDIIPIVPDQV